MKLHAFLPLLLVVGGTSIASADILVLKNQGNTPVSLSSNELVIAQPEVERSSDPSAGDRAVSWALAVRSKAAEQVTAKVAFPVVSEEIADEDVRMRIRRHIYKNLKVTCEGKPIRFGYKSGYGFHFLTRELTWNPGETKIIKCTFSLGSPGSPLRSIEDALPSDDELHAFIVPSVPSESLSAAREPNISMDEEAVRIQQYKYGFRVTCEFTMTSHAKDALTRTIGFPVIAPRYGQHMGRSFKVKVDDKPKETRLQMKVKPTWAADMYGRPDHEGFDYPGYVVWVVDWDPGQTRTITCTYDMGHSEQSFFGFARSFRLLYVVRTGALWKGTIGKADISVTFSEDPRTGKMRGRSGLMDSPEGVFRISYPEHAQWTTERELRWHFTNWEPTKDILVERAVWLGRHDWYFFKLPYPYEGGTKEYSDAMLNHLVEQELEPWKDMFPKEVAETDRGRLKATIAQCLFHEIKARHGEPFILGKVSDKPWPKGANESSDGFLYGKWKRYFDNYSFHGGWYRPDVTKKTKGLDAELNDVERTNRRFLEAFSEK